MERIVRALRRSHTSIDDVVVAIFDVDVVRGSPLEYGVFGFDVDFLDKAVPHVLIPNIIVHPTGWPNVKGYWFKNDDQCCTLRRKTEFMEICIAIVGSTNSMDGVIRRIYLNVVSSAQGIAESRDQPNSSNRNELAKRLTMWKWPAP
jgi:hypothetical protein